MNAHDQIQTEQLPDDPDQAIRVLIELGLNLEGALIEENKALNNRDPDMFQAAQEKKRRRFGRYDAASREFRYNLDKFRQSPADLINQLESLQARIKDLTQKNMDYMKELTDRAQAAEMGIKPDDIKEGRD